MMYNKDTKSERKGNKKWVAFTQDLITKIEKMVISK